jgi:hypothetical protein
VSPQTLAPSGINGGLTSLIGQISGNGSPPPPIPEPTALALMGILAIGAGLRVGLRRIRSDRGVEADHPKALGVRRP